MKFDETLIKKAVKEFNDWQGDAVIMCDEEDGEVWTDVFVDANSWKKYHSDSIHTVYDKRGIPFRNKKVSIDGIKMLLEAKAYQYKSYDDMPHDLLELCMKYNL